MLYWIKFNLKGKKRFMRRFFRGKCKLKDRLDFDYCKNKEMMEILRGYIDIFYICYSYISDRVVIRELVMGIVNYIRSKLRDCVNIR